MKLNIMFYLPLLPGGIRLSPLAYVVSLAICASSVVLINKAHAEDYFNPALLAMPGEQIPEGTIADLSHFSAGGQAPGEYPVKVYVNNQYIDDKTIIFDANSNNQLNPRLTIADYESLGLRVNSVEALRALPVDQVVENIRDVIPAASTDFRFFEQRLDISIPQMLMQRRARGEVDPASWDNGLPVALLNYTITGNQTRELAQRGGTSQALFTYMRGGLNAGAWRLRSNATYQRSQSSSQGSNNSFNIISTYLQRDVRAINGQLTLGDTATPADVFDSVQFQGGQLISDESMLPDSLRGFAPVIRGVSDSGAEVTIRQNDSVIYQSYVPPGPFEITDLYPASLSGDLVVTIKENDGSERTFSQPYSSIAIMQREGQLKYAMAVGRLRSSGGSITAGAAKFVQGTLIYGLPNAITVYGGIQLAKEYMAASVGLGIGLGNFGAVSADITQSDATLPNGDKSQGQSYRLRYSRSILETGTSVSLAAYRYSTEGYYNLQDAFTEVQNGEINRNYRPRGEFLVTLNQSLGDAGSMYLSGSQRDYWNKSGTLRTWTMGYNTSLLGIGYGLNFSQSQDSDSGKEDRRFALTASVPLSRWLAGGDSASRNSMQMNYGLTHSQGQGTAQRAGLSGSALANNQLNYNVSQSVARETHSTNLGASYRGRSGVLSAGYNRSNTQEQINYGLQGGILAHPYGITLAQDMGETATLIRAPGAANIKVNNQTGLSTDWRGYAVMPYMSPYRRTDISLDPQGLGTNVALDQTSTSVTPTRGAVVLADFKTQRGHQVMMTLRKANGDYVPFGATAKLLLDEGEQNNGSIVGDEGLLYISGMPDSGSLEVQWGRGADASCKVNFNLKSASENQMDGVPLQVQSVCQNSEEV